MMNKRKKKYPVKTSVNLLYRERSDISPLQAVLAVAVFSVLLALFTKFAVIDRLAASARALQEAEELEMKVAMLEQSNSDYDDVLREYQHYYFTVTDSGSVQAETFVDCLDLFELLETEFINKAGIQTVNLMGNVLTINLTDINLERASVIAKSLSENEMVKNVEVSIANRQQDSEVTEVSTVYMNIILEPKKEADAEQDMETEGNQ